jgi:hypothetical protein
MYLLIKSLPSLWFSVSFLEKGILSLGLTKDCLTIPLTAVSRLLTPFTLRTVQEKERDAPSCLLSLRVRSVVVSDLESLFSFYVS